MPNLPTEEVFTTPDPERTEGTVTSTKPLVLTDGTVVRDLVVRFEGGRVVEMQRVRGRRDARDDRPHRRRRRAASARSRSSTARAGSASSARSSTTRCWTRTPRATSRSARASRSCSTRATVERSNTSEIHIDFMIGSNELAVTGITADGERVPVLVDGRWQI